MGQLTNDQLLNIVMIIGVAFVIFAGGVSIFFTRKERAERVIKHSKKNKRNTLYWPYRFFKAFPLTKGYFQKIQDAVANVYPADDNAVDMRATKMMLAACVVGFGMFAFTIAVSGGDLFYILLGITLVILAFSFVVDVGISNMEASLLEQFSTFLSQVRNGYERCGRVDDAVGDLIEKIPYEISLHAARIHKILKSTHVIDGAEDYADISPNQFFTTFVEICATTIEYGDKKLADGGSMFERNLTFLKEEVNNELLRRQMNNAQFAGLSIISIAPAFFVKMVSSYWISNIPDMASYYNGSFGTISMVAVFAISIACYKAITYLKDPKRVKISKDDGISKRVSQIRPIRRMINAHVQRYYSRSLREEEMLRMTGDHLGINAFIIRRFTACFACALAVIVVLTTSIIRDKTQLVSDFTDAYRSSSVTNEELKETMKEVAGAYLADGDYLKSHTTEYTESERAALIAEIQANTTVTEKRFASDVADLVIERVEDYQDVYFKWWYLLIIFGAAGFGFLLPYIVLCFKQQSVNMDMDDEVVQFQTIVLMLMHVDGCSVDMLLEWMERFAFCFKQEISTCLAKLHMKGQAAIQEMYDEESYPSFQNFVGNLLNVDNVGIEQAFSGIESEREFYKDKRREDNNELLQKKSNIAMMLCFVPLFVLLFAHFIYPVAQYAISELSVMQNAF